VNVQAGGHLDPRASANLRQKWKKNMYNFIQRKEAEAGYADALTGAEPYLNEPGPSSGALLPAQVLRLAPRQRCGGTTETFDDGPTRRRNPLLPEKCRGKDAEQTTRV
jgi:hypothetical protein